MEINIPQIASIIAAALAPFMPYLATGASEAAKALGETLGKAAFEQAKSIWEDMKTHFEGDRKIQGAALMLSDEPENQKYQDLLAEAIAARLKEQPALAEDLYQRLAGIPGRQRVHAEGHSLIENSQQEIQGSGKQEITAKNDSAISGISQRIKKR